MHPVIAINNKLIVSSIHNNFKFVFFGVLLITYFAWMDMALFINLQRYQPPPIPKTSHSPGLSNSSKISPLAVHNKQPPAPPSTTITTTSYNDNNNGENGIFFGVFHPLSVKLIMIDHMTHYVHDVVARVFEDFLHFTYIFPWMTPNFVSFMGLAFAAIGARLIISDDLTLMRLGAFLFEVRNLCDSLDGVVYRSRKRKQEALNTGKGVGELLYQSNYGSAGYNVDAICDGLGGLFFVVALMPKFLRHLPRKRSASKLIKFTIKKANENVSNMHGGVSSNIFSYSKHDRHTAMLNGENNVLLEMENPSLSPSSSQVSLSTPDDQLNSPASRHDSQSDYYSDNDELINNTKTGINDLPLTTFNTDPESGDYHVRSSSGTSSSSSRRHISSRQVKIIIVSFGIRLLVTSLLWDSFVHKYHDLLMIYSDDPIKRRAQGKAFKSIGMWLIMWFWRLCNGCAILEHLTISTFFGKLWDYLYLTTYIGWIYILFLSLVTQIHYSQLHDYLNSFSSGV